MENERSVTDVLPKSDPGMLGGISTTETDYINLAERAIPIEMPLADDIESMIVFLDGELLLLINETKADEKEVNQ